MSLVFDKNLRDIERCQDIPITSFSWMSEDETEWIEEICDLGAYLAKRARGGGSILVLPDQTYHNHASERWAAAKHALDFIVATSAPCAGHILRGRMLDVIEARLPGFDNIDKHVQIMDCFNEAMHSVWMKEVGGDG